MGTRIEHRVLLVDDLDETLLYVEALDADDQEHPELRWRVVIEGAGKSLHVSSGDLLGFAGACRDLVTDEIWPPNGKPTELGPDPWLNPNADV